MRSASRPVPQNSTEGSTATPILEKAGTTTQEAAANHQDLPPQWSHEQPKDAPIVPPGALVSAPSVSVLIDGKSLLPQFHGSHSERMAIASGGTARLAIDWPGEHKTSSILASTANDGTVNGEPGVILSRGKNGRFQVTFQAGEHAGATQVILRAANLAYTLNFWVPTGNPNVDPPTL